MNPSESGFRPEAPEARELSQEEEVEQEARQRREVLLKQAQDMNFPPDVFVRKMMSGEIAHDPEDLALLMDGWEQGVVAEFRANGETQKAAIQMMVSEIGANRLASAFGVMDRFQIPEHMLTTQEMQSQMKEVALAAMARGDSSGSVSLLKRCKVDDAFLRSDEMRQAALACRGILAKKLSASVVARRIQLEGDFNLPSME